MLQEPGMIDLQDSMREWSWLNLKGDFALLKWQK
jgi:hypothetical protein